MAAQTAQPWRCEPVIRPSVYVSPDGIAKISTISKKFESGVGFSKGWALLALKNPPPLVPNSLITSWDATGPCAITCCVIVCVVVLPSGPVACAVYGWTRSTVVYGFKFCTTPSDTRISEPIRQTGSRTQSRQRVVSTQKFPSLSV